MCGICGAIWTSSRRAISGEALDRMTDSLAHRGPDDRGTRIESLACSGESSGGEGGIALGHRRLSILDLSDRARQPMSNEDGSIWLTFNGEIYNYRTLKRELLRQGHRFQTESDSEVLVHLYEEHGTEMLPMLSGMFAFALWDSRRQQLLLAVDRMGKKPLYYKQEKERLLFASELKAIMTLPDVDRKIDLLAFDEYLTYQYVPYPRTIYEGISKLPPGTFVVVKPEEMNDEINNGQTLTPNHYWSPGTHGDYSSLPDDRLHLELKSRLETAVTDRLQSDVPLGAFLSGGIDSTIIVSLMQRLASSRVKTFSIGFHHPHYDETPFARRTAERLGTEHHEFFVTPDAQAILPELIAHYDEPFADSSAIPTWYLSKLTSQEVTVALSGDGGDELFLGYDRYKAMRWSQQLDRLPLFLRRFLAGPVRSMIPNSVTQRSLLRRAKRFLEAVDMSELERYLQWIAIFNRSRKQQLYNRDFSQFDRLTGHDALDFLCLAQKRIGGNDLSQTDLVSSTALLDLVTYLPGDLMTKVDRASMRFGLEVRAPFLDNEVVALATQLPLSKKLSGSVGKKILRETFASDLPQELLQRPKTGFGVPLDFWFRGSLNDKLKEILLDRNANSLGIFDPNTIRQLIREHETKQFDHAARLWSLMVFEIWCGQNHPHC